jgi:cellulose biosynthesis protein BcsQ
MEPTITEVKRKSALMVKLERMKQRTRNTINVIAKGAADKHSNNINNGYQPVTYTLNQVRKLPELTHVRAESAIAELKNKGMCFARDEDKETRPWSFTLADVRAIYKEAGVPSFKQRLESTGRYAGATVMGYINLKGGVGKTTTSSTISSGFVHSRNLLPHQLRVLIIDMDPQGSISVAFGYKGIGLVDQHSAVDAIREQVSKETLQSWIKPTSSAGLYILPASRADAFFSIKAPMLANKVGINTADLLSKYIIDPLRYDYDVIIIDCGPHLDASLLNVIECADSIVIPTGLDPVEFDSTLKFVDALYDLYEMVPTPRLAFEQLKFIATKYDDTNPIHVDNYQLMMMTWPGQVLSTRMSQLRAFGTVFDDQQTVYTAQPKFYAGDTRSLKRAQLVADQVVTEVFSSLLNGTEHL